MKLFNFVLLIFFVWGSLPLQNEASAVKIKTILKMAKKLLQSLKRSKRWRFCQKSPEQTSKDLPWKMSWELKITLMQKLGVKLKNALAFLSKLENSWRIEICISIYSKTSWDTASWDTDLDGTLFWKGSKNFEIHCFTLLFTTHN